MNILIKYKSRPNHTYFVKYDLINHIRIGDNEVLAITTEDSKDPRDYIVLYEGKNYGNADVWMELFETELRHCKPDQVNVIDINQTYIDAYQSVEE